MKQKAKAYAAQAHKGQLRKSSKDPYITHPVRVAEILEKADAGQALVCAAYLHDVVEDTEISMEKIQHEFGKEIAALVAAHTEDKTKTWKERKQHSIDVLKTASRDVKMLIIADRLDNLLSLEKDLEQIGPAVWDVFNAGCDDQKWYNRELVKYMTNGLAVEEIPSFFSNFKDAAERIFR